jgi:hypothetical protein
MTLFFQRARQRVIRRRREIEAILGDSNGNVYAGKSRYWVRIASQTDDDNNVTYGNPLPIRYSAASSIPPLQGVEVLLKVDYDNQLSIMRVKPNWFENANIDSRTFNQGEPQNAWVLLKNVVRWLTRPVGSTNGTDSTLITIRENPFFVDDFLDWFSYAGTTRAADKPDLASYIPAADTQCLVCIFFDTFQQTYKVTTSTAQALTSAIDSTDYDECFAQLEHNEYVPLVALILSDNQSSIDVNDVTEDLRQFMNTPRVYGFPNPIPADKAILIRSTHQQLAYDLTVEGSLTVEGDMTVL